MEKSKVAPIISTAANIQGLRTNYLNVLISAQERGDSVVMVEADIAAKFEIAIQLARIVEVLEAICAK